jgi:hypothetical protein
MAKRKATPKTGQEKLSGVSASVEKPALAAGGDTAPPELGNTIQDLRQSIYALIQEAVEAALAEHKNASDRASYFGTGEGQMMPFAGGVDGPNLPVPPKSPEYPGKMKLDQEGNKTRGEAKAFKDHRDTKDNKDAKDRAEKSQNDGGGGGPTPYANLDKSVEQVLANFASSLAGFRK